MTDNNSNSNRFYLYDWLVVGYSLLMDLLILLLGRPLRVYYDELVFYSTMAVIAALIARHVDINRGNWHALVRLGYPALMFTLFYTMTGGLMYLVFDRFLDPQLTAFEHVLFGVNPTIYIDRYLLHPVWNELFSLGYWLYYPMIPVFLLTAILRKHYAVTRSFLAAVCLTFFLSYLLFFLYPVEGPRWFFADQYTHLIESPFSRQIVEFVIENGAVRGGCMPSSHFGVALVILMYCFRYYRKVAWWLLPIVIGLAVGTVWGRFHYVSDVIVGGLIGLASTMLVWKYADFEQEELYKSSMSRELEGKHVS